jgi:hypothetical protein
LEGNWVVSSLFDCWEKCGNAWKLYGWTMNTSNKRRNSASWNI